MDQKIFRKALPILCIIVLLLASIPVFFEIYRSLAFDTVPHDDYALYLLALLDQGGRIPGAPFVYRILSVASAIPAYLLLPVYSFTNLQDIDPAYLRANEALAFMSYTWLVLTALVIYLTARRRYSASRSSSMVIALSTFLLSGFISKIGIDPLAIFMISLLLFCQDRLLVFIPLILLSIGINEKIPIVFASLYIFRCAAGLFRRRRFTSFPQLGSSILAVIVYFLLVLFFLKIPGNESQVDPSLFLDHVIQSVVSIYSLKGMVTNGIPILIVALMVILAFPVVKRLNDQSADGFVFLAILLLALAADLDYTVGRIVMYTYPLYLPAAAVLVDRFAEHAT